MAKYNYEGFTKDGKEMAGTVEAKSMEGAAEHVRLNLKVFARKIEPAEEQPTMAPAPAPAPTPKAPASLAITPESRKDEKPQEVDWKELLKERMDLVSEIIAKASEASPSSDLGSIESDMRRSVIFGIFSDLTA